MACAQMRIAIPQSGSEPVNHRRKNHLGLSRPIMAIAKAKMRQESHDIDNPMSRELRKGNY
jgi:hypothetical protein